MMIKHSIHLIGYATVCGEWPTRKSDVTSSDVTTPIPRRILPRQEDLREYLRRIQAAFSQRPAAKCDERESRLPAGATLLLNFVRQELWDRGRLMPTHRRTFLLNMVLDLETECLDDDDATAHTSPSSSASPPLSWWAVPFFNVILGEVAHRMNALQLQLPSGRLEALAVLPSSH